MSKTRDGQCDCCRSNNVVTVRYKGDDDFEWWFCELCGTTMASLHDRHGHPDREVQKTICYVGNQILESNRLRENCLLFRKSALNGSLILSRVRDDGRGKDCEVELELLNSLFEVIADLNDDTIVYAGGHDKPQMENNK